MAQVNFPNYPKSPADIRGSGIGFFDAPAPLYKEVTARERSQKLPTSVQRLLKSRRRRVRDAQS